MTQILNFFTVHKEKNTIFFKIIKWLTLVLGFSGSLGFYTQAFEIWQQHSAGSVSMFTYAYWALVNIIFALYMLTENNKVVLATSLANLVGCLSVMLMILLT